MILTKITDRTHEAIDALGEITGIDSHDDPERLVYALANLGELKGLVSDLESLLKTEIINAVGERGDVLCEAAGVTASIKPRPAKQSRDWKRFTPVAIDRMCEDKIVNESTGQLETDREAIVRQLPDLVPMTASVKAKTTGLAALGFERDEYVDTEWAAPSVRLVKNVVAITNDKAEPTTGAFDAFLTDVVNDSINSGGEAA